MEQAKMARLA